MEDIGIKVAEVLLPVLMAALTWGAARLASYINAKVKNEYLRGMLVRLNDAVVDAVKEAQQVAVASLAKANSDGVVTAEENAKVKADVMAVVQSHIGKKGLAEIGKVLGLDDGTLAALLSTKIEAAVYDIKSREAILGAASVNPPQPLLI